jgi:hypothetical protein
VIDVTEPVRLLAASAAALSASMTDFEQNLEAQVKYLADPSVTPLSHGRPMILLEAHAWPQG